MIANRFMLAACLALLSILTAPVSDQIEAAAADHAGLVVAVDRAAGTFVMDDMGPLRSSGKSEATRYTIEVTSATEFVHAKRASGVAPSGWAGEYVETKLPAWEFKPGDFVVVTSEGRGQRLKALKVTVVDTTGP